MDFMGRTLVVVAVLLISGCAAKDDASGGPDPFAGQCDFPSVTEMGSNAAFVGGVMDGQKRPLESVQAKAVPQAAGEVVTDTSNQGGCYYLGLEPGRSYELTWSKAGYLSVSEKNVVVPAGEKRIHHVSLKAAN